MDSENGLTFTLSCYRVFVFFLFFFWQGVYCAVNFTSKDNMVMKGKFLKETQSLFIAAQNNASGLKEKAIRRNRVESAFYEEKEMKLLIT